METREQVVKREYVRLITTQHELKILMHTNNPRNEPVGILTGRCKTVVPRKFGPPTVQEQSVAIAVGLHFQLIPFNQR